jgi:4-hydroxy-tetrahydrodipicolinate synthase
MAEMTKAPAKADQSKSGTKFGLSCALSTPFRADGAYGGAIDIERLIAHARRVMTEGADSVTVFGTTGEGFAIGPAERAPVYTAFVIAGFDFARHVGAAVIAVTVEDAVVQARQALELDCRHILLAPPFYLKGVDDDGLFNWHSQVFKTLGSKARDMIVYNLPSQTGLTISPELVTRLRKAHPGVIIGVKDSAGNWPYTERMLQAHGDLAILIGDERLLARAVRAGGQGSICGLANSEAGRLRKMVHDGTEDPVISALVGAVVSFPVLQTVKALIATKTGDASWNRVRAPVSPLTDEVRAKAVAACRAVLG